MKADIDLKKLTLSVSHFFHRYHIIIFVVIVLNGLSFATFLLYSVVIESSTPVADTGNTTFDQATIDKLSNLRGTNDTNTPIILPSGRTNPFQ